jgi:hypothetical protein
VFLPVFPHPPCRRTWQTLLHATSGAVSFKIRGFKSENEMEDVASNVQQLPDPTAPSPVARPLEWGDTRRAAEVRRLGGGEWVWGRGAEILRRAMPGVTGLAPKKREADETLIWPVV